MARTIPRSAAERSNRLLLIGAVLFAGVAAALVFALLASLATGGGSEGTAPGVPIVVAARDIRPGEVIKADMVKIENLPSGLSNGAFQEEEKVTGQVATVAVFEGDPLIQSKLGKERTDASPASAIPEGLRAVAVKVEEEQVVGGLVKEGDLVDVIVVLKNDEFDLIGAQTVMQSIQVFAVAQEYADPAARTGGEEDSDTRLAPSEGNADFDANPEANTVTLLVSPQQVQELVAYQTIGDIALSLRTSTDEAEVPLDQFIRPIVPIE